MKSKGLALILTLVFNALPAQAAQTFCGLKLTEAWPEVVTETAQYFTRYMSSQESERESLEKEFEKLATQSIKHTEEDRASLSRWVTDMRSMLETRNNPELVRALTVAAVQSLDLSGPGSVSEKIKKQLKREDPNLALELGLSIDEKLQAILENSKDSALKESLAQWREDYPETLGVFLVSTLLQQEAAREPSKTTFLSKVRESFGKLVQSVTKVLSRKSTQSISDRRFARMLEFGPKAEKRLRLVTAIQVGLVVGSAVTFLELPELGKWNSLLLQVFGPYLGMKMNEWALNSADVDQKKRTQNRWAVWTSVVLTQTVGVFFPQAEWISNFIVGPGGGGVYFGRVIGRRAYSMKPESAADAIVDSQVFDRLSLSQLEILLTRVSESQKASVEKQIKILKSQKSS